MIANCGVCYKIKKIDRVLDNRRMDMTLLRTQSTSYG